MTSAWQFAVRFDTASRGSSVPLDSANQCGVLQLTPLPGRLRALIVP